MKRIIISSRTATGVLAIVVALMLVAGSAALPALSAPGEQTSTGVGVGRESGERLEDLVKSRPYYARTWRRGTTRGLPGSKGS